MISRYRVSPYQVDEEDLAAPIAEIWVVNASPLISLDRIGSTDILSRLGRDLAIPAGVLAEIAAGPNPIAPSQLGMHRAVLVPTVHPVVAAWDLGTFLPGRVLDTLQDCAQRGAATMSTTDLVELAFKYGPFCFGILLVVTGVRLLQGCRTLALRSHD